MSPRSHITRLLLATALLLPHASQSADEDLIFTPEQILHWSHQSFVGHTRYELIEAQNLPINQPVEASNPSENKHHVLMARARGTASARYREVTIDLTKTPYLQWRWRVDKKLHITDAQQKSQDDYPARIYLIVKEGIFPWQVRTLNYVWASHKPKQKTWPNPYSDRAMMIPLRDEKDSLQQWHSERINVVDDYRRVFGQSITEIHGIAIMTDADNTGGEAHAYYDALAFTAD